ncbi:helix-turn-helix domain-containing protein [Janibacter sp. YIM B02568]|uniref:PucR family transcriptional regulator n=1 Tax=Janibacter endophyticus TaxID=2806261 RepID=UPI00195069C9|nr:helix-turn-helix domain-containing protein [Janibacter endophyticus]MBM6545406.1 helix-turn-helix domain-containing protein [Janibacter endophyticus]
MDITSASAGRLAPQEASEVRALRAELEAVRALDGATGLAGLVAMAQRLLGKPVALFDDQGRVAVSAPRDSSVFPSLDVLRAAGDPVRGHLLLGAGHATSLARRHLLGVLRGPGDEAMGWVSVQEKGAILGPYDSAVLDLLSRRLAGEMRMHRRVAALAADARSHLARQLVRGTAAAQDLRATGSHLGVDVDVERILVVLIQGTNEPRLSSGPSEWEHALSQRLGLDVIATRGSQGLMLLVEVEAGVPGPQQTSGIRDAVTDLIDELEGSDAVAGVGEPVQPSLLPRAYREVHQVALCASRNSGSTRVLALDDVGPLRLFLANLDSTVLHQHVDTKVGALLQGGHVDLLRTLQTWFDHDRSARATAAALSVHENTVRLRLGRVHHLTGLDPTSSVAQLDLQLALLILRIHGHPAMQDSSHRRVEAAAEASPNVEGGHA